MATNSPCGNWCLEALAEPKGGDHLKLEWPWQLTQGHGGRLHYTTENNSIKVWKTREKGESALRSCIGAEAERLLGVSWLPTGPGPATPPSIQTAQQHCMN